MYHYTECGLLNVWLVNGFSERDTPYGKATEIENVESLHRAIALNLVRHKPTLTGSEFRFLRTELDLSQSRLAEYFGYESQAVALWEKRGKVPKWADRFLRALYREVAEGNAHIQEIITRLNDLDRQVPERHEFEERAGVWGLRAA